MPATITTLEAALIPIWTKRSDQTTNDFVATRAIPTRGITSARATLRVANLTANLQAQWGYQTSDDEETWGSTILLGPTRTSDGTSVNDGFFDISANIKGKLFVRFVITAINTAGNSSLEMAMAGGLIDFA